jgi:hypothetical protein
MPRQKHVHKFRRHRFKTGGTIFFCTLPDCTHKIAPELALGKMCICWKCGREFRLEDYELRLAKPHCKTCHRPKHREDSGITPIERLYDEVVVNIENIPEIALTTNSEIVETIPAEIKEDINQDISADSASDLKSRLFKTLHSTQHEARPDDDGDI